MSAPTIYRLSIERYRSIKSLTFHPAKGVNLILGGGDVGKTTILDAVSLLLSPTNTTTLSDTEYFNRNIQEGFEISAVVSVPAGSGMDNQAAPSWPWSWNGTDAVVPGPDPNTHGEAVYRIRVRGTEDLELAHEIVQPSGDTCGFPVALRRSIGLVRLGGDDRNDRDLRLVQGSALDRLLSDKGLRSRLANELAEANVEQHLKDEAQKALEKLDAAFETAHLPKDLELAITGGQGLSIAALIGLTADRGGIQLPLASWGAGTRRMAALAIAEQNQGDSPITVIDEIERGLEPYRQHVLLTKLEAGNCQAFVTTHSSFAVAAAVKSNLWYVDHQGAIGALDADKIKDHRSRDPETFLSSLAIVAEGKTERSFIAALLKRAFASVQLKSCGVHISDGGGHDPALTLVESLAKGGLKFGVFADNEENKYPERWKKVGEKLGPLLFRWPAGCLEENVINAIANDKLEALLTDPTGDKTGRRLRTLADRLGIPEKDFQSVKTKAGADLRKVIIEAAKGIVPDDKKNADKSVQKELKSDAQDWFKTDKGGAELAEKMFTLGVWPSLKAQLLPFCNAVLKASKLPELTDIT